MIEEKLTNYEAVNEKLFLIDSLTNKLLNERKNINKELAYANTILSQQAKNQIAKIESERPNLIFLAADATIKQNQLSQNNYEFPFRNSGIRLAENVKLKVCFIFIDSLNILSNHYITNEIYEDTEFPSFTRAGTNRSYSIELNKSHHAGNKLMYLIFNFSYYDSLLDKYHSHVQTYYINDRNKLSSYNKINSNQLNTYIKLNNIVDFKFDF